MHYHITTLFPPWHYQLYVRIITLLHYYHLSTTNCMSALSHYHIIPALAPPTIRTPYHSIITLSHNPTLAPPTVCAHCHIFRFTTYTVQDDVDLLPVTLLTNNNSCSTFVWKVWKRLQIHPESWIFLFPYQRLNIRRHSDSNFRLSYQN